jgi:hypothetical protein
LEALLRTVHPVELETRPSRAFKHALLQDTPTQLHHARLNLLMDPFTQITARHVTTWVVLPHHTPKVTWVKPDKTKFCF